MELFWPPLDSESARREVRERIQAIVGAELADSRGVPASAPLIDVDALRRMAGAVKTTHGLIGKMPPQPPTFRARVGAVLVRLVRRALFWYTPQIVAFHAAVTQVVEEQVRALEALNAAAGELERLREALSRFEIAARSQLEQERAARQAAESAAASELAELRQALRELRDNTGARLQDLASLERLRQAEARLARSVESVSCEVRGLEERWKAAWSAWEQQSFQRLGEWQAGEERARELLASELKAESEERATLGLRMKKAEERLRELDSEVRLHGRRLSRLENAVRGGLPEALRVRFEEEFRGSREEIKRRLRVYLPRLAEMRLSTGARPMVLDLGCGRGEWLELLREAGVEAEGVDHNRALVAGCVERGLKAHEADAIEYLRGLPADSVNAVTAFHLIEHLPFPELFTLLNETIRVLKPGGLAIFETPNPANVLVGSERFYFDPTHQRPLPTQLARFLAEGCGFSEVEIMPLHPWPEASRLEEDGSELVRRFNEFFYGPQDYAIIGHKPKGAAREKIG